MPIVSVYLGPTGKLLDHFSRNLDLAIRPRLAATIPAEQLEDGEHSLAELERRQDDVLAQLDELDKKLTSLLTGLGVTLTDDFEDSAPALKIASFDDEDDTEQPATSSASSPVVMREQRKVA